jgi:hypothetical protein
VSVSSANAMNDAPLVSIIVVTYGTGPIVLEMLDAVARAHAGRPRGDRRRLPAG